MLNNLKIFLKYIIMCGVYILFLFIIARLFNQKRYIFVNIIDLLIILCNCIFSYRIGKKVNIKQCGFVIITAVILAITSILYNYILVSFPIILFAFVMCISSAIKK